MSRVRLLPLLALAGICLLALKTTGLLFSGGYVLTGAAPASAKMAKKKNQATDDKSPAEAPAAADKEQPDQPPPARLAEAPETKPDAPGLPKPGAAIHGAELAVLQNLSERRKVLDERARELQLRENLLKAAEQRVEARIAELKAIEQRIESQLKKRDDARSAEYEKLVVLYSKMKPKNAAQIFNRLDIDVLTDIVRRMQPRIMSPIFAAMNPSVAERVTMEIAKQGKPNGPGPEALPKIAAEKAN